MIKMTKERFNLIFAQNVNGNRMGNEYQNASLSLCSSTLYIDIRSPFEISIVSRRAEPCFSIHAQSTLCTYIHTRVYSSSFGVRYIPKMHTSADSTERFLLFFFFLFFFFIFRGNRFRSREENGFVWKCCERTSFFIFDRSWLFYYKFRSDFQSIYIYVFYFRGFIFIIFYYYYSIM